VNAVRALAQILRRYTSLNHLAQAARAVLQNSNQITQMLADINKVDFTSVQVGQSRCNQSTDTAFNTTLLTIHRKDGGQQTVV